MQDYIIHSMAVSYAIAEVASHISLWSCVFAIFDFIQTSNPMGCSISDFVLSTKRPLINALEDVGGGIDMAAVAEKSAMLLILISGLALAETVKSPIDRFAKAFKSDGLKLRLFSIATLQQSLYFQLLFHTSYSIII